MKAMIMNAQHVVVFMLIFARASPCWLRAGPPTRSTAEFQETFPPAPPRLCSDLFRRPAQGAHGDHHAQHGGDNAEAGKRIGHGAQRLTGCADIVMMYVHVELDHLVEIEGLDPAAHRHAHGVADKIADVMVFTKAEYFDRMGLFAGSSISASRATMPSLRPCSASHTSSSGFRDNAAC